MNITIRSNREAHLIVLFLFIATLIVSAIIYTVSESMYVMFIICGIYLLMVTRYWVTIGRTVVLNSYGITISFLWITRIVSWEQLRLRKLFSCEYSFGYRSPYSHGIELSHKPIKRPSWIQPIQYCFIAHPFSYVVINFPPDEEPPIKYPSVYEYDGDTILSLFEKWGIINL